MKQRRAFLRKITLTLFSPLLLLASKLSFGGSPKTNGVIRHQNESETFLIRPNAPVTIRMTKTSDRIESISFSSQKIGHAYEIPLEKHLNVDEMILIQRAKVTFML